MICKIAGLGVSVPDIGDLPERCVPYGADVKINIDLETERINPKRFPTLSENDNIYLESGARFYLRLLEYDGLMLHSSAVLVDGLVYLFSGPSGVGKSTHTGKYRRTFPSSVIINDDKPALRKIDGIWYAFGTPWCGKDGINANACAPIAGICFLHRGDRKIARLSAVEALPQLLNQTIGRGNERLAALLMKNVKELLGEIPMFELFNHAQTGDELITYSAMHDAYCGKEKTNEA